MKSFRSLLILVLCLGLVLGVAQMSFAQKYPIPSQYSTIADYKKATGKDIRSFNEAPMFTELVKQGKLPSVEKRLPSEPLVIMPVEEIGKYGGDWRTAILGMTDDAWLDRTISHEGLVRVAPDLNTVVPNLAKSWKITEGGKTFTFYLRKGVKWSDGEPFTADDIMFWYEDIFLNKELTPTFPSWLTIDNQPVKVEKVDDYTVRFKFTQPNGLFLQTLATTKGLKLIVPKHYLKQFHPKYTPKEKLDAMVKEEKLTNWFSLFGNKNEWYLNPEIPVIFAWRPTNVLGSGPRFICERNPYYWKIDPAGNQLPYLDRVVFDMVENAEVALMKALNGELDMHVRHFNTMQNYTVLAENREKGGYRFFTVKPSGMNTTIVAFNLNQKDPVLRKIFNEKKFRFAMSLAINRKEMIDLLFLGMGEPWQNSPVKDSPFYHERLAKAYTEYDPVRANKLLDEIGLKRGPDGYRLRPDGKPLSVTIEVVSTKTDQVDACELIKKYWEAVGVKTAIKTEDRSLFYTRKVTSETEVTVWNGDGGIEVLLDPRWYFPYSHESNYAPLWQLWYNTGGKSGEEPPAEVKKQMQLYDEIKKATSFAKQKLLMKQILDIDANNLYVIGISTVPSGYGIVKNNFRNVPEETLGSSLYSDPFPTNTCQYFKK
ncbi:MAG TPA: ABC transporter substrate-binding protein [bacterium]|jgi:peptide/nickel transport system substrate-binding protein|nr:ABC transporter substrate-binding protein [bacterium]